MEEVREKELFEDTPVTAAILRLAVPTVIGQIILVVYNLADTFFIGLTGSDAMLTAVTVCMPAFMFLSAISNLFGIGGASVISRALGVKKRARAQNAASFAFWGCVMTACAYSLGAWLFMDGFVDILGGTDPQVHAYATAYLTVTVVMGGFTTSLSMLLSHLVRAEGRSVQASFGIALGGILNIILDPLFMFVILPAGNEALGAAVATALANAASCVYFLAIVLAKKKTATVICLSPRLEAFRGSVPRTVLCAGLPACLMTLFENISYAVLDKLMSFNGTQMQAGIGVAKKVNMLAHCIVRGIAQGALPLIGYNFASGNYRRMRQSVTLAAVFAVASAGLCMAFNMVFSVPLIEIFIRPGSASVAYGARFLRILCLGAPFSACAYTMISFFQAIGEGAKSFLLAILRKGLVDIPLMFALRLISPVYGIVWATPVADFICCAAALAMAARFMGQYADEEAKETRGGLIALGGLRNLKLRES